MLGKTKVSENKVKNSQTPTVDATGKHQTRCPKCLSIRRTKYNRIVKRGITGIMADGTEYDHITWRRTACQSCGQHRIDMQHTLENKANIPPDLTDSLVADPV